MRCFVLLLAVVLLLGTPALPVSALAEETAGEWQQYDCGTAGHLTYRIVTDGTSYIEIGKPNGTVMDVTGELAIPAEINGVPVKNIQMNAFMGCHGLTGVTLPEGVERIEAYAFAAGHLERINIPSTVTYIGDGAFKNENAVCAVTVSPENTNYTSLNGGFLCEISGSEQKLLHFPQTGGSLAIPEGVTELGNDVFPQAQFESVSLPASLKTVSPDFGTQSPFSSVTAGSWTAAEGSLVYASLDGALYTKDKTTLIKYPAGKSSFDVENTVTVLAPGVFAKCSFETANLSGLSITSLPDSAFDSGALRQITLPSGLTAIGERAFWDCENLQALAIPDSVTSIGWGALSNCTALASLHIPAAVTGGIDEAFRANPQLKVTVDPSNTAYSSGADGRLLYRKDGGGNPTVLLHAADGADAVTLPDTVTEIGESAFWGCSSMPAVTLPAGLTKIGSMAFQRCKSLRTVTIPAAVTTIGDYAFNSSEESSAGLQNVCDIVVENGNPNYFSHEGGLYTSDGTLVYMPDQNSVTLSPDTTKIGDYAFAWNQTTTSVTIPEGVTEIGEGAFFVCSGLTSISLPSTLTHISRRAFGGYGGNYICGLREVELPESVIYMGTEVFLNCDKLTRVTVAEQEEAASTFRMRKFAAGRLRATKLESGAFTNCPELTTAEISPGMTEIAAQAFVNCPKLKHVVIPEHVTAIDADAFGGRTDFTIYGETGSSAEAFANSHSIPFKAGKPEDQKPTVPPVSSGDETGPEPEVPELPFTDAKNHWAVSYIQWAYENEIFKGISETVFAPDQPLERAMLACVLYRIAGEPAIEGKSPFTDVPENRYYTDAVIWAERQGIISGIGDGRFAPHEYATREQIVSMLYRYEQQSKIVRGTGDLTKFSDESRISSWAREPMSWAVGEEILHGDAGRLRPGDNATRAETAVMLHYWLSE